MPNELKKRGRREEKKRKREQIDDEQSPSKRPRSSHEPEAQDGVDIVVDGEADEDYISFNTPNPSSTAFDTTFYGLLTPEEQEYYSSVNAKLDLNDFDSDEDRTIFIEAVHRESEGKEIKLASSQSCSRYLEKIILLSDAKQLNDLFDTFAEALTYLVQHRFGSHVIETLFLRCASFVGSKALDDKAQRGTTDDIFLVAAKGLMPDIGYLLTEKFASHAIRVLLLVLSGEPLQSGSAKVMLASRKKEKIEIGRSEDPATLEEARKVPESFRVALSELITAAVASLDTTYLRALATHPTGNPVLQLLLRLELTTSGKLKAKDADSVLRRLIPDESLEDGSESGKFIQGLIYDPTGSHLIETLVQYMPGKQFKKLYKNHLQQRLGDMAKNDIASYVAIKVLERLSKDDLTTARDQILPEIPGLVARYRTGLIKVLVERCNIRQVDMQPLANVLSDAYGVDKPARLLKMLKLSEAPEEPIWKTDKNGQPIREKLTQAVDIHGSLLAQAMLQAPGVCTLIYESLLAMPDSLLLLLANDPVASRVLQLAFTSETSTLTFRRQFVPMFFGHMADLATDAAGSHLADALWDGTSGAQFMKERLAKELQEKESVLRDSRYGRSVWKNWSMDLYLRRYRDWQALAKGYNDRDEAGSEQQQDLPQKPKSGIELARQRYANQKARGFHQQQKESYVHASRMFNVKQSPETSAVL